MQHCAIYSIESPNCFECSDNRFGSNCSDCASGALMENDKCEVCYNLCSECTNQTSCMICYSGERIDCSRGLTIALFLKIAFGLASGIALVAGVIVCIVRIVRNRRRQVLHVVAGMEEQSQSAIQIVQAVHPFYGSELAT